MCLSVGECVCVWVGECVCVCGGGGEICVFVYLCLCGGVCVGVSVWDVCVYVCLWMSVCVCAFDITTRCGGTSFGMWASAVEIATSWSGGWGGRGGGDVANPCLV